MILNSKGKEANEQVVQKEMLIQMMSQNMIIDFKNRLMDLTIADFVKRLGNENMEKIFKLFSEMNNKRYEVLDDQTKLTQIGQILESIKHEDERKQMFKKAFNDFEKLVRELFFEKNEKKNINNT